MEFEIEINIPKPQIKFKNMLNFLKRVTSPKIDVNEVILEIHNEFDSAGERLLLEAKEILSGSYDTEQGEKLKSLGFLSAKKAVDAATIKMMVEEKKKVSEQVEYYKTRYPFNKFITEVEVQNICKKYGLLCGDATWFTGDVPHKNINEMAAFKLLDEDCTKYRCHYYESHSSSGYPYFIAVQKGKGSYGYIKNERGWHSFNRISDEEQDFFYEKPLFKICATVKDFDMTQMRVTDGYKLEQNLPDPVVLQPVLGGYLVVSKWGLEGQDESLTNEKMN